VWKIIANNGYFGNALTAAGTSTATSQPSTCGCLTTVTLKKEKQDNTTAMPCTQWVHCSVLALYANIFSRFFTTKMAQKNGSKFSDSNEMLTTVREGGYRSSGSYTVTLDANPSVEQVQTYTTKPLTPTSYVPSSSEFDFMSSSLGSPSGTIDVVFIPWVGVPNDCIGPYTTALASLQRWV